MILYHYTDEQGVRGILLTQQIWASTRETSPKDVRYGNGQYLSDIEPGSMTSTQLSRAFLRIPWQGRRYTHFVAIDTAGLQVKRGRTHVYVIPNSAALDVGARIVRSGKVG